MNLRSWLFFCWQSARARPKRTGPSTSGLKGSLKTETKQYKSSDKKCPSFYLMAASLLLFISAVLGLSGASEADDPSAARLIERGWQKIERLPCHETEAGKYYELQGDEETVEVFAISSMLALAAKLPLPSNVNQCREISTPHFIEEI